MLKMLCLQNCLHVYKSAYMYVHVIFLHVHKLVSNEQFSTYCFFLPAFGTLIENYRMIPENTWELLYMNA
jgi:hypothetical protein